MYIYRLVDLSGCYEGVHDAGLKGLAGCSQLQIIKINYLDQVIRTNACLL